MHAPQASPLSLLHDRLYGLSVAFIIPFHGLEHPQLCLDALQLGGLAAKLVGQFVPALGPGRLAQGIAGDGIFRRLGFFLGASQLPAAIVKVVFGFLLPRFAGIQVAFQLLFPLGAEGKALVQAPQVCFAAGNFGAEPGLLAAQLQKLLLPALGVGGHSRQLLLQSCQAGRLFLQQRFDLGDTGLGLVRLGGNAAGAVFLVRKLLPDALNIIVVIGDIAPDHRHLAIQLLVGRIQQSGIDAGGFQLAVFFPEHLGKLLALGVKAVQLLMGLLQHKAGRSEVLLRFSGGSGKLFQGIQPHGDLHALQLFLQGQILNCLFRLHL